MAKLSAHGEEIGRINYTTYAKAYMADGKILKNYGQGWKLYGKCKVSPQEAYAVAKAKQDAVFSVRPCLAAYRKELHSLAGMSKAWKLHAAVELLGDDVDGIWSEACDGYGDNVHADVDEVGELVRLYNLACAESADMRQAEAA
jgi:hypothetical protein